MSRPLGAQRLGPGALALGVASMAVFAPGVNALSLSPPWSRLSAPPGGHAVTEVVITNTEAEARSVVVEVADWQLDQQELRYQAAGSLPQGCGRRVEVFPRSFRLGPGEARSVTLGVDVDSTLEGSCFAAVIFASRQPPGGRERTGEAQARVRYETGIAHFLTVDAEGTTRFAAQVDELTVTDPLDTRPLEIRASLINTGNCGVRARGTFAIVDAAGDLLGKADFVSPMSQPGARVPIRTTWEGLLGVGRYRLLGTVELDGGQVLVPEAEFEVVDHLELRTLEARAAGDGYQALVRIDNDGHLTHLLAGRLDLAPEGGGGQAARSVPMGPVSSLPGRPAEIAVTLGRLEPGRYQLQLVLWDDGAESRARLRGQVTLEAR